MSWFTSRGVETSRTSFQHIVVLASVDLQRPWMCASGGGFSLGSSACCDCTGPVESDSLFFSGCTYGVVPKGLFTFLDSLYKEVAKTTSGTLVCRFEKQTARKKYISSFEKYCVLGLECRILSQEPSDSCSLYFNVVFHGK